MHYATTRRTQVHQTFQAFKKNKNWTTNCNIRIQTIKEYKNDSQNNKNHKCKQNSIELRTTNEQMIYK